MKHNLKGGKFLSRIKGLLRIGKKKTIKKNKSITKNKLKLHHLPNVILKYNLVKKNCQYLLVFDDEKLFKFNGIIQNELPTMNVVNTIYQLLGIDTVISDFLNGKLNINLLKFTTSPLKIYCALKFFQTCEPNHTIYNNTKIKEMITTIVDFIMKFSNNEENIKKVFIEFIKAIFIIVDNESKVIFKKTNQNNSSNIVLFQQIPKLLDKINNLNLDDIILEDDLYAQNTISSDNLYLQLKHTLFQNTNGNIIDYIDNKPRDFIKNQKKANIFNNNLKEISKSTVKYTICKDVLIEINLFNLYIENMLNGMDKKCFDLSKKDKNKLPVSLTSNTRRIQKSKRIVKNKSKILSEYLACIKDINIEFDNSKCYLPLNLEGAKITTDDVAFIVSSILTEMLNLNKYNEDYSIILEKYFERLKIIYKYNPNVSNIKDKYNNNIIHQLLLIPNTEILDYTFKTIDAKKVINKKNTDGDTPLHLAIKLNKKDHLKILLNNEANLDEVNNNGDTPLHLLMMLKENNIELIKTIIEYYNEKKFKTINNYNKQGYTPLHILINNIGINYLENINIDYDKIFRLLLNFNNIDLNKGTEKENITPILLCIFYYARFKNNIIIKGKLKPLSITISNIFYKIIYYLIRDKKVNINIQDNQNNTASIAILTTKIKNNKGQQEYLFTEEQRYLFTGYRNETKINSNGNNSFKSAKSSLSNSISSEESLSSQKNSNAESEEPELFKTWKRIGKTGIRATRKTFKAISRPLKKINFKKVISNIKFILTKEELREEFIYKPIVETSITFNKKISDKLYKYCSLPSKFLSQLVNRGKKLLYKCKETFFLTEEDKFKIITDCLNPSQFNKKNLIKLYALLLTTYPKQAGILTYKIIKNRYIFDDIMYITNNISNFKSLANFLLEKITHKQKLSLDIEKTDKVILQKEILKHQKYQKYFQNNRCLKYYKLNKTESLNNITKIILSLNLENISGVYSLNNTNTEKLSVLGNYLNNIGKFMFLGDLLIDTKGEEKLFEKFGVKLLTNPELNDLEIIIELLLAILVDDTSKSTSVIKSLNDLLEIFRLIYNIYVVKKNILNEKTISFIKLNYKGIDVIKNLLDFIIKDKSIEMAINQMLSKIIKDNVDFVYILNNMENIFNYFEKTNKDGTTSLIPIDIQCFILNSIKDLLNTYSFINFGVLQEILNDIENKYSCKEKLKKLETRTLHNGGAGAIMASVILSPIFEYAQKKGINLLKNIFKKIYESIKKSLHIDEYIIKSHTSISNTKGLFKDNVSWENYHKYINLDTKKKVTIYDIINDDNQYPYLSLILSTIYFKGSENEQLNKHDQSKLLKLFNPIYNSVYNQLCEDPHRVEFTTLIPKTEDEIIKVYEELGFFSKIVYGIKSLFNKIDPEIYRLYVSLNLLDDIETPVSNIPQNVLKYTENEDNRYILLIMKILSGVGLKRICNSIKDGLLSFDEGRSLGKLDKTIKEYINIENFSIKSFTAYTAITHLFTNNQIYDKDKILSMLRKCILVQIMRFNLNYKFKTYLTDYDKQVEIYKKKIERNKIEDAQENLIYLIAKYRLLETYKTSNLVSTITNNEYKDECTKIDKEEIINEDLIEQYKQQCIDNSKYSLLIINYKKKLELWVELWEKDHKLANKQHCITNEDKQQLFFWSYIVGSQLLEDLFDYFITPTGYFVCDENKEIFV